MRVAERGKVGKRHNGPRWGRRGTQTRTVCARCSASRIELVRIVRPQDKGVLSGIVWCVKGSSAQPAARRGGTRCAAGVGSGSVRSVVAGACVVVCVPRARQCCSGGSVQPYKGTKAVVPGEPVVSVIANAAPESKR